MATHIVYDKLLEEIDDDLEARVFETLANHAGERVSRETLVLLIFGRYVKKNQLASDSDDRKIRKAIENLQERGIPILANSGQPGYILSDDPDELKTYINELSSRYDRLGEKINNLRRAHSLALRSQPSQPTMF